MQRSLHMSFRLLLAVLAIGAIYCISGRLWAQEDASASVSASATGSSRALRIGYLAEGSAPPARAVRELIDAMQDALVADEALRGLFAEAGFDSVVGAPAASVGELTQNMAIRRYDIVFAPVAALRAGDAAGMTPVFQQRRPGDAWDPRGARGVRQTSVLFQTSDSDATPAGGRWAFVGGDSAAGYIYPRLRLLYHQNIEDLSEVVFRTNEDEVFLLTMSGLADFGAMDKTSFDRLQKLHRERVATAATSIAPATEIELTVIDRIELPAPPVLFSESLAARASKLGARLRRIAQEFFENHRDDYGVTLVNADARTFSSVEQDLETFYSLLDRDVSNTPDNRGESVLNSEAEPASDETPPSDKEASP